MCKLRIWNTVPTWSPFFCFTCSCIESFTESNSVFGNGMLTVQIGPLEQSIGPWKVSSNHASSPDFTLIIESLKVQPLSLTLSHSGTSIFPHIKGSLQSPIHLSSFAEPRIAFPLKSGSEISNVDCSSKSNAPALQIKRSSFD